MSITLPDIDFAAAEDALARLDKLLGNFSYAAPEDAEKTQYLLTQVAASVNDFATAMRLIKPRSERS